MRGFGYIKGLLGGYFSRSDKPHLERQSIGAEQFTPSKCHRRIFRGCKRYNSVSVDEFDCFDLTLQSTGGGKEGKGYFAWCGGTVSWGE